MLNKVLESSFLLVCQQIAQKLVGVISTVVLARILSPEDFGVVAIAMLVLWFADAMTSTGTDLYIIQKETLSDSELNSAWTLDLILKVPTYIFLVFGGYLFSIMKEDSELAFVIASVGLLIVFGSFKNPGLLILKREQNYKKMVVVAIITKLLAVFISIPAAIILKNHWALVLSMVFSNLFNVIVSYWISSYRPSLDLKHVKVQWEFSKWLIPQAIIGFLRSHIDTAIVSARFSASDLGGYNTTKYFAFLPVVVLINPLTAPLHVELGKVNFLKNELKKQYDLTSRVLGFVIAPIISLMLIYSKEITVLILGNQWLGYSQLLGCFAFTSASMTLLQQTTRLAMINKKTKLIFGYEVISSLIILGVLVFSPKDSIFLLAIIKVVLELLLTVIFYQYIYFINFKVFPAKNLVILFFPTMLCSIALYGLSNVYLQGIPVFVQLAIAGSVALFSILSIFMIYLLFFATNYELNFSKKIYNVLRKILGRLYV